MDGVHIMAGGQGILPLGCCTDSQGLPGLPSSPGSGSLNKYLNFYYVQIQFMLEYKRNTNKDSSPEIWSSGENSYQHHLPQSVT